VKTTATQAILHRRFMNTELSGQGFSLLPLNVDNFMFVCLHPSTTPLSLLISLDTPNTAILLQAIQVLTGIRLMSWQKMSYLQDILLRKNILETIT